MKDQDLRHAFSEIRTENYITGNNEIELIKCECCGMSEECTHTYISEVRDLFCGKWICGICSEAVKEITKREPGRMETKEALDSHMAVCMSFNKTTRLNPHLSFAGTMRDIARKNSMRRRSLDGAYERTKISRTMSCGPWLDTKTNHLSIQ
ncbi:hypothetical protein LUZ60_009347 [Juncus effusus]|nr:hypothetical protein LUZ60_009347 [Juncus effusus]